MLISIDLAYGEQGKPLSVCQVLSNLENYQGKSIQVIGYFEWGRHGWYLEDNVDSRSCPMVGKKEYTSYPALFMQTIPSQRVRIEAKLRPFQEIVNKEIKKEKDDLRVIATLRGELHFEPNVIINRDQEGNFSGNGYGLDGACRAALIIEEILEASVVKKGK